MNVHDFKVKNRAGEEVGLEQYRGRVLLIVNTASKCGFTPQLAGLEKMYKELKDKNFTVLGFPCGQFNNQELDTDDEIQEFCQINYGVTFPVFSKIEVNGANEHPLYTYMKKEAGGVLGKNIKWNFTKFLIDAEGRVVKRFGPTTKPEAIRPSVEKLL